MFKSRMQTITFTLKIGFLLSLIASFIFIFVISKQVDDVSELKDLKKKEGLRVNGKNFTLEGEKFRIMSGALHYFRIPHGYWADRMLKAKSMGLNTIETYIPWNMHEPQPGMFNFDDELSLSDFVNLAQTHGLYVILRPGPYICAEWDLGGLPSWLLRDPDMHLRSMYPPFLNAVDRYFDKLMPILRAFQYSNGGPVIAFQIENEYGSYGSDVEYMKHLEKAFIKRGIVELLFTSDNAGGLDKAQLPGVLQTVNLQTNVDRDIDRLEQKQPQKPVMVTEFWTGWFDHWGEDHHVVKTSLIGSALKRILDRGASFNLYMFHGGTNFGFMNGANTVSGTKGYTPTVTSYDYDAPVAETGDLTKKFHSFKTIIENHAPKGSVSKNLPWTPDSSGRRLFGKIQFEQYLPLKNILKHIKLAVELHDTTPMEMLPINNNAGQSYGYVLYSTLISNDAKHVTIYDAADRVTVILDDVIIEKFNTPKKKLELSLPSLQPEKKHVLQILVENCGRINYDRVLDDQRKGIRGHVEVNGKKKTTWKIYPLEFKHEFINSIKDIKDWRNDPQKTIKTPAMYKGTMVIQRVPYDSILHIKGFDRGVVFLNGRNLGRFDRRGPQETLYVPSTYLFSGENIVILFDQGIPTSSLEIDTVMDHIYSKTVDFHI